MTPGRLSGLLLLAAVLLAGCRSTKSGSTALASVVFSSNTPGQISRVVDQVFTKHGYKVTHTGALTMLCEREASMGSKILYGNWTGDTPVWIRAKIRLVLVDPPMFRLECDAYRVRDRGSLVEEEIAFGGLNKGHFQDLLNECLAALQGVATKQ